MESNDLFIYLFVCLFFISPTFQMHYLSILVFSYSFFFYLFIYSKGPCFRETHYKKFNYSSFPLLLYSTIQTFNYSFHSVVIIYLLLLLLLLLFIFHFVFFPIFFSFFFVVLLVLLIYRLPIQRTGCGISLRQLREHKQCWKG